MPSKMPGAVVSETHVGSPSPAGRLPRTHRKHHIPKPIPEPGDAGMVRSLRSGPVVKPISREMDISTMWGIEADDDLRRTELVSVGLRLCRVKSLAGVFSKRADATSGNHNVLSAAAASNNKPSTPSGENQTAESIKVNSPSSPAAPEIEQGQPAEGSTETTPTEPPSEATSHTPKLVSQKQASQAEGARENSSSQRQADVVKSLSKKHHRNHSEVPVTVPEQLRSALVEFPHAHCVELDCSVNYVTQLEARIPFLEHLRSLDLSLNLLQSTQSLGTYRNLHELNLSNNSITVLAGLSKLTNLRKLNLSGNQMRHMRGLGSLTQLYELRMAGNAVRVVEGLETMTELELLDMSDNVLVDMVHVALVVSLKVRLTIVVE
jgi:Leucine-rich repeat (LRR) protein